MRAPSRVYMSFGYIENRLLLECIKMENQNAYCSPELLLRNTMGALSQDPVVPRQVFRDGKEELT